MIWQFSVDHNDQPVTAHFTTHKSAAQTDPLGPECLAKTSKKGLKPHKINPHFRVQEWAGFTFCYLAGGVRETHISLVEPGFSSEFQREKIQRKVPVLQLLISACMQQHSTTDHNNLHSMIQHATAYKPNPCLIPSTTGTRNYASDTTQHSSKHNANGNTTHNQTLNEPWSLFMFSRIGFPQRSP